MIGSLIVMFIIGALFAFSFCAIGFLKYVDKYSAYPSDADLEDMYMSFEEKYHGKH